MKINQIQKTFFSFQKIQKNLGYDFLFIFIFIDFYLIINRFYYSFINLFLLQNILYKIYIQPSILLILSHYFTENKFNIIKKTLKINIMACSKYEYVKHFEN